MDNILSLQSKDYYDEYSITRQAIKGDESAFCLLIKMHKEYLYKIAYAYVKNEEKALDILQETTYKSFISINKIKKPEFFKTWITRILINTSINIMKKSDNVININEIDNITKNAVGVTIEETIDLYNAIDLLSDKYKMIIILRYFNDMKIEDISQIMKIPISTVKTCITRAKAKLSEYLGEGYLYE